MTPAPVFTILAALALLCACAPAPHTPEEVCRAQSNDDPTVHDLKIQALGSAVNYDRTHDAVDAARDKFVTLCLKRQGIAPKRGGVQKPDRTNTLFQG